MIGYHSGKKAYKLWDPIVGRIVMSRDVTFDESVVLASPLTVLGVTDDDKEFVVEAIVSEKVTGASTI